MRSYLRPRYTAASGADYFEPVFYAPQLTPKQFLIISSPSQQKIVFTELKNFQSTTGRTFALIDSGLVSPSGLSFDRDRGALYVADKGAQKIYRYHIYKQDDGNGLKLITDGVQLCIMENVTAEWVFTDVNGDVFFTDEAAQTINRIPVGVIKLLAKGRYAASDLQVIPESQLVNQSASAAKDSSSTAFVEEAASDNPPQVFALYQASIHSNINVPAGVASDGVRLYWVNGAQGQTHGSVAEGEVDPQAQTANGQTTSFPSLTLTNASATAYGVAKTNTMVFYSTASNGLGTVNGLMPGTNAVVSFATGLASPRGLVWDGDQTLYVADMDANSVYSFPVGRLVQNAPLAKSAVLSGAFGLALFAESDKAWNMKPIEN
jgi:hypothetical protein